MASDSLPTSVSSDFYLGVAKVVSESGGRLVLDTPGKALQRALAHGVHLARLNLHELEGLAGRPLRRRLRESW